MEILAAGLSSTYDAEHLARVFFPGAALRQTYKTGGDLVYARLGKRSICVGLRQNGVCHLRRLPRPAGTAQNRAEEMLRGELYRLLRHVTRQTPPWGMLTGVRPVNHLRKLQEAHGSQKAEEIFLRQSDVSPERYALAKEIVQNQAPVLAGNTPQSYSLYISIPFCPTRCSYCSFVSRTLQKDIALVEPYLAALEEELILTAAQAKAAGLKLETVYIGGGTPTSLTAPQLEQLLLMVEKHFAPLAAREYTVEAGRPDCTDFEKLALLKQYGVGRISINPQSMNDEVLRRIGRRHTAEDIRRCMQDARRAGHQNINMDLIAGLPGDTPASFANTLSEVLALAPENITLHTLTLKRASSIVIDGLSAASAYPGQMLEHAYTACGAAGYRPYYLYRQKNTPGNLENTGWAKPGTAGLYNIFIMEEAHSILAVGAGASTKLVNRENGLIRRIINYKYPADYLAGFSSILERKKGVQQFYAGIMDT